MNRVLLNLSRILFLTGGIALATTQANAQMKIGDNPTDIKRSAILELNSSRQGLLLPRLQNFTGINTLIGAEVVDGMVVYLASGTPANDGLYMRQAGAWVKIASAADALANWSLKGNVGTDENVDFIGTTDAQKLSIRANNAEAISVQTNGELQLKQVLDKADNALLDVVVINTTDGTVSRRALPQTAFNTLASNIAANVDIAHTGFNVSENTTTGQITINAPLLDAATTATYGFLSKADWDKLQALTTGNNFSVADFITTIAAGEENRGGQITYDAATASYTLELVAASATLSGIVTTGIQTFGGEKTFANNLTAGNNLQVNNNLAVTANTTLGGTADITGNTTIGGTATVTGVTTLDGALTLNSVADVPTADAGPYQVLIQGAANEVVKKAFDMSALETAIQLITIGGVNVSGTNVNYTTGTTGEDFNLQADAATKTVTFNLPDAKAAISGANPVRGAVSTGDQSFAGNKSFAANVAVGKTDPATSTLQVEGSVSLNIRTASASGNITATDNTVLANATAGAITLTLPAATGITGRLYTIKKIAGGLDNAVTITSASAIEDGTSYAIYNDWTFVTVQSNGTSWYIVRK